MVHFELNLGAAMLNSEEIDIPCPECGHEASKTVDWVKANDELSCRRCGSVINLENERPFLIIAHVTRRIAKLRRSLAKFRNNARGGAKKRR
ncbi:hypothetical protein GOL30_33000 [Sinorhizobium medicae]|uniref:Uncharacterized protein n=2 Tax=Sinorhizobium medicae TaxID=110321 RepID=A0A6G1WF23_9HYPH|nr:hypothetical protein [Sinorhizobium medicae]MDX0415191.1 hypothetical protein [Sinorhizobium medicae]MDX0420432.1 hypothetical protein [Sinorhizobium medicae]MDX0429741.1 hypothetical protein [Sinorhizobium medicae]MDX0450182.1 hypothetical protein [Sinorhizobium medicae]